MLWPLITCVFFSVLVSLAGLAAFVAGRGKERLGRRPALWLGAAAIALALGVTAASPIASSAPAAEAAAAADQAPAPKPKAAEAPAAKPAAEKADAQPKAAEKPAAPATGKTPSDQAPAPKPKTAEAPAAKPAADKSADAQPKAAEKPAAPATGKAPSDQAPAPKPGAAEVPAAKPAAPATAEAPSDQSPAPKPEAAEAPSEAEKPADAAETAAEQAGGEPAGQTAPVTQIGETKVEEKQVSAFNWIALLEFVGILVGSVVLGALLASVMRVPEYQTKLTIIVFSLIAGIVVVVTGWPPKRGIDLAGGVILVYEMEAKVDSQDGSFVPFDPLEDAEAGPVNLNKEEMDKLVAAISKRINPGGVKELTIRPFGRNEIEIIIPEADESEIARYKQKITSAGTLEFRILANNRDHAQLIDDARKSEARLVYMVDENGQLVRDETGAPRLRGWWVPLGENTDFPLSSEIAWRQREIGERTVTEILVVHDPYHVTGSYLVRAAPSVDQTGRPNVEFMFNAKGGQLFGQLTSANLPDEVQNFYRKLGIVLDGHLFSAPIIKSMIRDRGEISGDFTKEEVRDLVDVLNAGMLPTTLKEKPVSELATGPLLGQDTIRRGTLSIGLSLVAVLAFMIFYYRFAGVAAAAAMLSNLLLIVALMILIKGAFTLPGLAGVVLTVGMAVDANVLIYERIREELDRQATLRMAIRNGFARATVTIIDANLTTVITAIVLYIIGSDQVKGFAVTLILGIVLSMFTAVYCSRAVFEIAEKRRWLTKIKMARLPLGGTIDFIGQSRVAGVLSAIVILVGLVAVVGRGRGLMDIDFTGGVSIQAMFNQDQDIEQIRTTLTARDDVFDDLAVSELNYPGNPPHRHYVINTSSPDAEEDADKFLEKVKLTLQEIYGDKLVHHSMTITPAASAASAAPASATPSKPEQSDTGMRDDLPPENLLAAADSPTALRSAQASASADPEPSPAAESAGKSAGPEEAPSKPEPKNESAPAKPAAETAAEERPGQAPKGVEATTWTVDFGEGKMTYATLEQEIQAQIKQLGAGAYFELANPEYAKDLDADRGHSKWTVSLYLPEEQAKKVLEGVKASVEATPVFPSSNTIGGSVATDTQWRAAVALLASLVALVIYIWIRFERVMFGVAAVIALVHDVLITLGAVAVSAWLAPLLGFALVDEFKISLSVLAAFLALIGYSLNDTIVVFDRIRELRGKSPYLTPYLINTSINQTLSRTIITSFTTLIVVVILYALGGQGIRAFAFSLIVGVLVGTYSSIFIAAPILLWIAQTPPPRDGQAR